MYVRPSNTGARSIKLPENYSGSAFSNHSLYSDMPPPTRTSYPREDLPPEPVKQEAEAVFVQDVDRSEASVPDKDAEGARDAGSAPASLPTSSLFSSLLPRTDLSRHFPFGHGIGSEELLILAVMLMVFLSGNERGEVDSEFLLLLGLLLFAG